MEESQLLNNFFVYFYKAITDYIHALKFLILIISYNELIFYSTGTKKTLLQKLPPKN